MWVTIALFIISTAISILTAPKIETPDNPPGDVDKNTLPSIDLGKSLFIVGGTRLMNKPNLGWTGDVSNEPIYSEGGKK